MEKLNLPNEIETIHVKLSKEQTPIAYENKVKELMGEGCELTREEAEKFVDEADFVLELYYQTCYGLFAVESDAIECGATISSPYNKEDYEDWDDEE